MEHVFILPRLAAYVTLWRLPDWAVWLWLVQGLRNFEMHRDDLQCLALLTRAERACFALLLTCFWDDDDLFDGVIDHSSAEILTELTVLAKRMARLLGFGAAESARPAAAAAWPLMTHADPATATLTATVGVRGAPAPLNTS